MRFRLHPLYILLGLAYIAVGQGLAFIESLGAVLLHEFSHMLAARGRGVKTDSITVYPYGGQIDLEKTELSASDELRVLIAGPLSNLMLSTLILGLWWVFPSVYPYTEGFYKANLFNGIFNLFPAYPLDGGRIVLALLKLKFKRRTAARAVTASGIVFASALGIFGGFAAFHGNFTPLTLAVFIAVNLFSLRSCGYTSGYLSRRKSQLSKTCGLRIRRVMVGQDVPLYRLISMSNRDAYFIFHVVDEDLNVIGEVPEAELYEKAAQSGIYLHAGGLFGRQKR